jgi:hypothetical protein
VHREARDQAVEDTLVHRRPGTWRGVLSCLPLALAGGALTVASRAMRGIGIATAVLGLVSALLRALHLACRKMGGTG